MRLSVFSIQSAVALLLLLQGSLAAQGALKLFKTLAASIEKVSVVKASRLAVKVVDARAPEESPEALANAAIECKATNEKALIFRARILQELDGETYANEVVNLLLPVLGKGTNQARLFAMTILSGQEKGVGDLSRIVDPMMKILLDPAAKADLRLGAAKSAYELAGADDKKKIKEVLATFLKSTDPQIRNSGALAMAEIGSIRKALPILYSIKGDPTMEGRLAKSIIKRFQSDMAMLRMWKKMNNNVSSKPKPGAGKNDSLQVLREIMDKIKALHIENENLKVEDLIIAAAKAMCITADRHTNFFTGEEVERFFFGLDREYGGIGAYVNFDEQDRFGISRPIYGGPAYKQGLRSGDKIIKINDWDVPRRPDMLEKIIERLKGKPGTKVKISIFRLGWSKPKDINIVRAKVKVPSLNHEILPGDIGYMELITFGRDTMVEARETIFAMKEKGVKSLVIDLRDNTGGYLNTAVEVADLFLPPKQKVVYSKSSLGRTRKYFTRNEPIVPADWPVIILVNGRSASASEILSGALQHHKRAILLGELTFGKGSVQQPMVLKCKPDDNFADENMNQRHDEWEKVTKDHNKNGKFDFGARIKITIAYYYLPNDTCINRRYASDGKLLDRGGIKPDVECEPAIITGWKSEEIFDLIQKNVFRKDYINKYLKGKDKLMLKLALSDDRNQALYPGFENFYKSLTTHLSKDDVRRWLRVFIREEAADLRGRAFAGTRVRGDFQEDLQLQMAIREILKKRSKDWKEIEVYKATFLPPAKPSKEKSTTK